MQRNECNATYVMFTMYCRDVLSGCTQVRPTFPFTTSDVFLLCPMHISLTPSDVLLLPRPMYIGLGYPWDQPILWTLHLAWDLAPCFGLETNHVVIAPWTFCYGQTWTCCWPIGQLAKAFCDCQTYIGWSTYMCLF